MDKFIEIQYVQRLGAMLPNFKQTKARTWAFSHTCETPKPGHRAKARGSIYEPQENSPFNVKCFHCGYSVKFSTFIKEISPSLFEEYRLQQYRENEPITRTPPVAKSVPKEEIKDAQLDDLIAVNSLSETNPVRRWLDRRAIPKDKYNLLYVAKKFFNWAKKYNEDFSKHETADEPRLVLPYFDVHGRVFGFTARTFSPTVEPRYIHIRVDKGRDFIYGTERIDPAKRIYVCEGHIDSLFLNNAIAVGGANYGSAFLQSIKTNCTIIPDSDWKRNSQVGKQLFKAIDMGFSVAFLPDTLKGKDINDFVKNGMSPSELMSIIDSHTASGLEAKLEFTINKKY